MSGPSADEIVWQGWQADPVDPGDVRGDDGRALNPDLDTLTLEDDWATSPDESACPYCYREACAGECLEEEAPKEPRKHRWQRAADVIESPGAAPIVEGIAWANCITVMAGESTAGKTFVMLDLLAHLSAGLRWHGREVVQGSVIYVPFEGHVGLRLRALRDVAGQRLENVYVLQGVDPISPICDRDRIEIASRGELDLTVEIDDIVAHIQAEHRPPVLALGIDTARGSMNGNENDSGDISAYLRAVRRLLSHVPGAAAILTHHSGWQDGQEKRKRERGSSAFRGNVDGTVYLEADDYDRNTGKARLTLESLKVREGENPPPLHLIRRRVEIPGLVDRWGQPATSCIIERDYRTREDREAEQAAATAAADRVTDLRVLGVLRDHPTARSRDTIAAIVGMRGGLVQAALGRILRAGWALPPERQRQPYHLTDLGLGVLSTSPAQSGPLRPGVRPSESGPLGGPGRTDSLRAGVAGLTQKEDGCLRYDDAGGALEVRG
ncbi:MAG: AAA family ATPase [Vicinamibacterales bacterium]